MLSEEIKNYIIQQRRFLLTRTSLSSEAIEEALKPLESFMLSAKDNEKEASPNILRDGSDKTLSDVLAYDEPIPDYGSLMKVREFLADCSDKMLTDYDGHGHPVQNGKMMGKLVIKPSNRHQIPVDATHIMWFNK